MSVVVAIIMSLLVLGILIAIHELGHFGAGKLLGFDVLEYSIGMGPAIFKKEKNGTVYALRCLPIGGMCKFRGEDEDAMDDKCFNAFPAWKRLIVVVAGPLMNIVFAFIAAVIMFAIFGSTASVTYDAPVIAGYTAEGSPAQIAGIEAGDYVVAINGVEIKSVDDMTAALQEVEGDSADITVMRPSENTTYLLNDTTVTGEDAAKEIVADDGLGDYTFRIKEGADEHTITVSGITNEQTGKKLIGVSVANGFYVDIDLGFFGLFGHTFKYLGNIMSQMVKFLGSTFNGTFEIKQMAGIVGIVDVVEDGVSDVAELEVSFGQQVSIIIEFAFYLMVLLSINLGFVNILPLPALDGGRSVFILVEMVRRKPVPAKVEGMIHSVGLILLLVLVVFVTFNDVFRIFG